jgi:hypothetical protein
MRKPLERDLASLVSKVKRAMCSITDITIFRVGEKLRGSVVGRTNSLESGPPSALLLEMDGTHWCIIPFELTSVARSFVQADATQIPLSDSSIMWYAARYRRRRAVCMVSRSEKSNYAHRPTQGDRVCSCGGSELRGGEVFRRAFG